MCRHKITPCMLSSYVNFCFSRKDWFYSQDAPLSMPKLQAEGASKVWNLLLEHKIALLADEVGMGKTIEALSVMATLWRQKPNAKILLYAPNENVARHWIREYNNFIRYHYRKADDIVKSSISNEPLRKAVYCKNHTELLQNVADHWPSFLVCKTSSLSGLTYDRVKDDIFFKIGIDVSKNDYGKSREKQWMRDISFASNDFLHKKLAQNGSSPFDLLIFDEAHYLRRTEGEDSNRSIVAHAFFAKRDISSANYSNECRSLAKRVLLLTATPNHSSKKDINSIVGLFSPEFKKQSAEDILRKICVRRLRRLEGKTKHEYREEKPDEVKLEKLSEKLFFAAYHKCLVDHRSRNKEHSKMNNPYRILWGYLEGFEFLPKKKGAVKAKNSKEDSGSGGDYSERDDGGVIMDLSAKYKKAYKVYPEHPKYSKITQDLTPKSLADFKIEKKLVFVRRIPSVREIAARVIANYDEMFLSVIKQALPQAEQKNLKADNLRPTFWSLAQTETDTLLDKEEDLQQGEVSDETDEEIPYSEVLDLFTVKKNGKYKTTDCSNFRVRFTRKEQLFSIFFEPARDYKGASYNLKQVYEPSSGSSKARRNYKGSVQFERVSQIAKKHLPPKLEDLYGISDAPENKTSFNRPFETLLGLWYTASYKSERLNKLVTKAFKEYENWNISEKEGFSVYLEKGILFSSPLIVHLYAEFVRVRKVLSKKRGEELYWEFCKVIRQRIESSGLAELIARSVLTFRIFYKKQLGLTSEKLIYEKWNFLNNTYPVYPYHAATKRESIIQAFNTPFFPYALVATSVLQEGVDLHYHCSEVIHYGIAWTQGDNEQRVGRVDRLFGKMDNALKEDSSARLPIFYPYLAETIDQDQLSRFIIKKNEAEMLIDQFRNIDIPPDINYQTRIEKDVWLTKFNRPENGKIVDEPYGVKPEYDFANIGEDAGQGEEKRSLKEMVESILQTIRNCFGEELVASSDEFSMDSNPSLCVIKHVRENDRHQPVLCEIEYFEAGFDYIDQPVYCFRIKTPLSKKWENYGDFRRFGSLGRDYYNNPLLKICYDKNSAEKYKLYVCCEIPLFLVSDSECNISEDEIIVLIKRLIEFSDDLEFKIMTTDISNDEMRSKGNIVFNDNMLELTGDREILQGAEGWKHSKDRQFLIKRDGLNTKINVLESFTLNNDNRFIRLLGSSGKSEMQAGIYKKDALPLEIKLLNSVFTIMEEKCR